MAYSYKTLQNGFTLVEISIVMIIIGLLIGGTFGGMKLIENMQVNKTVQDLKSIRSSALSFRDIFGRLPGDLQNPSTRIPNCSAAPCSTGGDGNRIIGITNMYGQTITAASENYTFWHHLQAADILSMGIKNTTDMNYGEGQPETPIGGGYLMLHLGTINFGPAACPVHLNHGVIISTANDGNYTAGAPTNTISCNLMRSIDNKADDGMPLSGNILGCAVSNTCGAQYLTTGEGKIYSKSF